MWGKVLSIPIPQLDYYVRKRNHCGWGKHLKHNEYRPQSPVRFAIAKIVRV